VAAGDAAATADGAVPASAAACTADDLGLTLPAGFCASLFAEGLGAPRQIAVRGNGDVYVARRSGPAGEGGVVALRDADGDGRAELRESFGPVGGTGVRVHDGFLYLDQGSSILRYRLAEGALRPAGEPDTIVSGLPVGGHAAHTMALDGRGGLFVNVGSRSNSCQLQERGNDSPGHDPCTELETRAGIWRFDATRTGQRFAPAQRWATGIRNALALEFSPAGELWVAQNGRDQLAQNWKSRFTAAQGAENPGEELIRVTQGTDNGWPYCYYSVELGRRVTAPEYGGDGRDAARCAAYAAPVAVFPAHWAPMSLLFYTGSQLPARYRDGVFVSFHGSWNREPVQAGFNVAFQPLRAGQRAGAHELFADGFAGGVVERRGGAKHRPMGLAQARDGSILVTDDQGGRIYRISYTGGR
jgi:glucose/arabinose dehydrogenase